jgi:multiple sugar transport system substrate-binding protein
VAAPGRTWDDLVADAAQVHQRTGDDVAGYVGQLADYEGLTVTALEAIWGAGGEVVDDKGRVLPRDTDITAVHTGLDRLRALNPGLPALDEANSRRTGSRPPSRAGPHPAAERRRATAGPRPG